MESRTGPGERKSVAWYLYVLRCSDGTFYTGISNNVQARVAKHNAGKGAKYTRGRTPVELLASWPYHSKGLALSGEIKFKKLPKDTKGYYVRHPEEWADEEVQDG